MVIWVKLLCYLIRLLPVRLAGTMGAGLGRMAYLFDSRHRHIAMRNLNRVYPDKPETWKRKTCRESFAELGRTILELPHVFLCTKNFLLSRITVKNIEVLEKAKSLNKGVIIAACHHSNWELGGLALSMLNQDTDVIYRTLRQPSLDTFVLQARSRFGAHFHARSSGLRWVPRSLKNNRCVAVMVDQHLSNGVPVPFLGHQGRTTTLPAIFFKKYHTPVISIALHRIGKGFNFCLEFRNIPINPQEANEIDCMQTICDSFAPVIHQRPELWLWLHRRWLYLDEMEQNEQPYNIQGQT